MKKINSERYDEKYFTVNNGCGSYEYWKKYQEKRVDPRLTYAIKLANIHKGEKILDFACGRGEVTVQAGIKGAFACGIDYSRDAISFGQESLKFLDKKITDKISFMHHDSDFLPFKDESFDVIFFLDIIEHVYPEELNIILKELHRVLKTGGRLILHTSPNKVYYNIGYKYYTRFVYFILSKLFYEPILGRKLKYNKNPRSIYELEMHINEQTTKSVLQSLNNSGFILVKVFLKDSFLVKGVMSFFQYVFIQPSLIFFLRPIFSNNIWSIAKK